MRFQKHLWYVRGLAVAICAGLVAYPVILPIKAQSIKVSLDFPPTENVGAPDRTGGGGQRRGGLRREGSCVSGNTLLTSLSPKNNVVTTVAANPTLYWYIPQTQARLAQFVIQDVDQPDNSIYETMFAVNGTPGIAKLSLPATVALATGKQYTWKLALICDLKNLGENQLAEGLIERVELSSAQQRRLAQEKDRLQQAKIYAQARVWQETLSILAQLRQEHPQDAKLIAEWQHLLDSVGLDAIATAPLVDCCKADSANVGDL